MTRETAEYSRERNIDFIENQIASTSQITLNRLQLLVKTNESLIKIVEQISSAKTSAETADAQAKNKVTEARTNLQALQDNKTKMEQTLVELKKKLDEAGYISTPVDTAEGTTESTRFKEAEAAYNDGKTKLEDETEYKELLLKIATAQENLSAAQIEAKETATTLHASTERSKETESYSGLKSTPVQIQSLKELEFIIKCYKDLNPKAQSPEVDRLETLRDRIVNAKERAAIEAGREWESKKEQKDFRSNSKQQFVDAAVRRAGESELEKFNGVQKTAKHDYDAETKKLNDFHTSMYQVRREPINSEEKLTKQLKLIEEQVMPGLNSALDVIERDITNLKAKVSNIEKEILDAQLNGTNPKELLNKKELLNSDINYKQGLKRAVEDNIQMAKSNLESINSIFPITGKSIDEKIGLMLNATSGLIAAQAGVALCQGKTDEGEKLFKTAISCNAAAEKYCNAAKEEAKEDRKEFWDNVKNTGKATFHWLAVAIMALAIVAVAVVCPPVAALLVIPAAYAYKNRETMGISSAVNDLKKWSGLDMKDELGKIRMPLPKPELNSKGNDLGDTPHDYVPHRSRPGH